MKNNSKYYLPWCVKILSSVIFLSLIIFTTGLKAETEAETIPLALNMPEIYDVPVTPGQTTAEIRIPIQASHTMQMDIIAPVNGVSFTLFEPDGAPNLMPMDPEVSFLDGSTLTPPLPGGRFLTPEINMPAEGECVIHLDFPSATEQTVIMATVFTDTPYKAGMAPLKNEYRLNQTAPIGMLILHEDQPILGLAPLFTITSPSGSVIQLIGKDDGTEENLDGLMDDGLYSKAYTFTQTGEYTITGEVTIPSDSGGEPIIRRAWATVNVTEPLVELAGINGSLVKDASGCIKGLNVHVDANILYPSMYVASTRLRDYNGQYIEKNFSREIASAGLYGFDLFFTGDEIRKSGLAEGVFQADPVDILHFGSRSSLEIRVPEAFSFPSISFSQFCRAPIEVESNLTVTPTSRDGFIDSLKFSFPITVTKSGNYQITFKVTGEGGEDIQLFAINQSMNVGANTVSVTVPYQKFQTIDGPYMIESVLIHGQGSNAQKSIVGKSETFSKWQFHPVIKGDLNADGAVNDADRQILLGFRNSPALQPGDRRDLDGDGQIDLRDARYILQLVCSAGTCPTR